MEGEYYVNDNSEGSTSKKNKINHGQGNPLQINLDRISDLNDSLLIEILSFLDTKDACKTSILSKRWKNVWTHVEKLVLDYDSDGLDYDSEGPSPEHVEKFISFVDHTLLHCASTNLKKFSLYSYCVYFDANGTNFVHNLVDKWLQCFSKTSVECFALLIRPLKYCAPEWFYHKSSFVKLHIGDWEIKILGQAVSWHSLKILVLSEVVIDDEQIAKILLGCPVLEDLSLLQPTNVTQLHIVSQSVRRLIVHQGCHSADILDLNTPCLREFEISGSCTSVIPRLINASSLITAKIKLDHYSQRFDDDEDEENHEDLLFNTACRLLESIHHIKELTLNNLFIQALSIAKHLGIPTPLFKCKHLTVNLSISKYELPGIACLLQSAPNLETLLIEVEKRLDPRYYFCSYFYAICGFDGKTYLSMQMVDFPHLKNVEVDYCIYSCYRDEVRNYKKACYDFELIEYILKNAPVLQKLVIKPKEYEYCKCSDCSLQYVSRMSHKLLGICNDGGGAIEFELKTNQSDFEFIRICNSGSKSS